MTPDLEKDIITLIAEALWSVAREAVASGRDTIHMSDMQNVADRIEQLAQAEADRRFGQPHYEHNRENT